MSRKQDKPLPSWTKIYLNGLTLTTYVFLFGTIFKLDLYFKYAVILDNNIQARDNFQPVLIRNSPLNTCRPNSISGVGLSRLISLSPPLFIIACNITEEHSARLCHSIRFGCQRWVAFSLQYGGYPERWICIQTDKSPTKVLAWTETLNIRCGVTRPGI